MTIHIPDIRTKRLHVRLRQLTIADSLALAAMPVQSEQATQSEFFRRTATVVSGESNPELWTVQERTAVVCLYLAAVLDDNPDFAVGDGGAKLSDYLEFERDIPDAETIPVGDIGGDAWAVRHLTGGMAEAIERLEGELPGIRGRAYWSIGSMAAQMVRPGDDAPTNSTDEWLLARMRVLSQYPESDAVAMAVALHTGRAQLHHLMRYDFAMDGGIVAMPKEGAGAYPPARFRVYAGLSEWARGMVGQSGTTG